MNECQFEEALMDEIQAAGLNVDNNADDLSSEAIARIAARTDLDDVILWMSETLTDQFKAAFCNYADRNDAELGRLCVCGLYFVHQRFFKLASVHSGSPNT